MEDPEMVVVLKQLGLGIPFITCGVWDKYKLKDSEARESKVKGRHRDFTERGGLNEGKHLS